MILPSFPVPVEDPPLPTIDVECSECATVVPIEEERLGAELKCPKCKSVFVAEKSGGSALASSPTPPPVQPPRDPGRNPSAGPQPESEPDSPPETEAERRQRERLEKWAEE